MVYVTDKSKRLCAGINDLLRDRANRGIVLHGYDIAGDQALLKAVIAVSQNGGNSKVTQELNIRPVKQFYSQYSNCIIQRYILWQLKRSDLLL